MKVLQVIPYLHPSYGGPVTSLNAILNASCENGINVDVLSTNAGFDKHLSTDTDAYLRPDVKKHIFDLSFPRFWFYSSGMKNWLENHVTQYDLLHLHIPFTAPFFMASKAAIKNKIPVVATLHGLLDPWSMSHKALKKSLYYQMIERSHLSSITALHVTSSLEAQAVKNLNLSVAVKNFPLSVASSCVPRIKKTDENLVRLLFIGRLHPVKSIPTILDAVKHLKNSGMNVVLDLAGCGDPSYEQFLREKINNNQIQDQVIWHGHANEAQKISLYQHADLFVLPSLHENFGLAAAEAMGVGLPVIVSDQVGLASDVLDTHSGLVVPAGDDFSLAEAVKKIYGQKLSIPMGQAALDLVKNRYAPHVFSTKLVAMYRAVLGHSKI